MFAHSPCSPRAHAGNGGDGARADVNACADGVPCAISSSGSTVQLVRAREGGPGTISTCGSIVQLVHANIERAQYT